MAKKPMTWERYKALEDKAEQTAWSRASAYLVFRGADLVGRIRFAHPKDGAGPLKVFVTDLSTCGETAHTDPMLSRFYSWAAGYGYDKHGACMSGCAFWGVTVKDAGHSWERQLENAGLTIHWAI